MAMPTKFTAFFRDTLNTIGWTESYYTPSGSVTTAALNAYDTGVLAFRKACLSDTCFVDALRLSNTDHPRDSLILAPPVNQQGTIASATHKPVGPWDALLIRQEGPTSNVFSHLFMRGCPQEIFNGRFYVPIGTFPATFKTALDAYYAALISQGLALRKVVGGTPTYPLLTSQAYLRRTERKAGRPFDPLRGRRAVA